MRRLKENQLEQTRNRAQHKVKNVNLGSNCESSHDERFSSRINMDAPLEPIKQSVGLKAVPWKTKSSHKHDFSYYVLMERQIAKAKKYLPTQDLGKLIDLSDFKGEKERRETEFKNIANNFRKQREQIKTLIRKDEVQQTITRQSKLPLNFATGRA